MHNSTTAPVSLTSEAVLERKAEEWVAAHGLPSIPLVERAIRRSDLAGDPFLDNPFRRALVRVGERLGAPSYDGELVR